MGEASAHAESVFEQIRAGLDRLESHVDTMDTTQQQLAAQMDLTAQAMQNSHQLHDEMARRFHTLPVQMA